MDNVRRLSRRKMGNVLWEMAPGMEESLPPLLEEMGAPVGGHGKRVYQEDPTGTTIYTVKTNRPGLAGELFVKVYRPSGIKRIGLFSRKIGESSREWRMAVEHIRRGLPSPSYLARGIRKHGPAVEEEYLVQESLTNYESFDEFFRTAFRPELPGVRVSDKRRVIRDLAGMIRRMHDRGVSRPHIKPANIMAAPRAGGGVNFVFRDLQESYLRKSRSGISVDERVLELARFHKSFSPLFSQGYRIRFYREYFGPDKLDSAKFQELVKRIVDLSVKLALKEEPLVTKGVRERRHPHFWFDYEDWRMYLRKPLYQNSVLEAADKLPDSGGSVKIRVKSVGGAPPVELMAVRCEEGRLPMGTSSTGEWAYLASALLDHHGISHFRVLCAYEKRGEQGGWFAAPTPGRGEYSLAEYLARRVADEFSGISWDRKFLIRVARYFQELHEAGFYFPEPSGDDLWVRYTDQGTHEIRVFNVHRLRRLPRDNGRTQFRSLFDLWCVLPISRTDGLMLAEEYLRFSRRLTDKRKEWLRRFSIWEMSFVEKSQEIE